MKTYALYNESGINEYNLEISEHPHFETVYTLKYSKGADWSEHIKGTTAMTVMEDGNGLIVRFDGDRTDSDNVSSNEIGFNYSDASKLNILFRAIAVFDGRMFQKYTMLPTSDAIRL